MKKYLFKIVLTSLYFTNSYAMTSSGSEGENDILCLNFEEKKGVRISRSLIAESFFEPGDFYLKTLVRLHKVDELKKGIYIDEQYSLAKFILNFLRYGPVAMDKKFSERVQLIHALAKKWSMKKMLETLDERYPELLGFELRAVRDQLIIDSQCKLGYGLYYRGTALFNGEVLRGLDCKEDDGERLKEHYLDGLPPNAAFFWRSEKYSHNERCLIVLADELLLSPELQVFEGYVRGLSTEQIAEDRIHIVSDLKKSVGNVVGGRMCVLRGDKWRIYDMRLGTVIDEKEFHSVKKCMTWLKNNPANDIHNVLRK